MSNKIKKQKLSKTDKKKIASGENVSAPKLMKGLMNRNEKMAAFMKKTGR